MDDIKTKFDQIMEQFSETNSSFLIPKKINFENLNDSLETASIAKKRKYSDLYQQQDQIEPKKQENRYSSSFLNSNSDKLISIKKEYDDEKNTSINLNNLSSSSSITGGGGGSGGGGGVGMSSSSPSSLNISGSSIVASPWEQRRIKADLLESKSLIIKLKQEIEQQYKIKAYTEELYENKVEALKTQCDYSSNKILDMEKHLQQIRKREKDIKTELVTTKNQLIQQKQMYEEKLYQLQKKFNDFEENTRLLQTRLQNELNDTKRFNEKMKFEYDMMKTDFEQMTKINKDLKDKYNGYDQIKNQLDIEKQENEKLKLHIKKIEYEMKSYGEWKDLTKLSQQRLSQLSDLEKEVKRLRIDNKRLNESLGNKLLLEEQVYDLKSRLENYENRNIDVVQLQVNVTNLEKELIEWKKIAEDHCLTGSSSSSAADGNQNAESQQTVSPYLLRKRIEELLQKDIILTTEKNTTKNEYDKFQAKLYDIQNQNDILIKQNAELNMNIKKQKQILLRIQKKLMIVIKERNCYKQLVENFEKDLTISNTMLDTLNPIDQQLKVRLDILEKSLSAYKDMCKNLEKELESVNLLTTTTTTSSSSTNNSTGTSASTSTSSSGGGTDNNLKLIDIQMINTDNYDTLKNEIHQLRLENEHLRKRKNQLELEIEQYLIKNNCNLKNTINCENLNANISDGVGSNGSQIMNNYNNNNMNNCNNDLNNDDDNNINNINCGNNINNKYKIIHMKMNPSHEAYVQHQNDIEKLQAEIERLKRKIRKLEDDHRDELNRINCERNNDNGNNDGTISGGAGGNGNGNNDDNSLLTQNTTANMTLNIKELKTLRSKLEASEARMQNMKDIYKSASLEFREVCYMLFGYRIDRIGNANYRISSMYAENENDYLNFRLNESGILDMLETDYSISLGDMVKNHLALHKSLPAFLSTLTLELFNRTTIMV